MKKQITHDEGGQSLILVALLLVGIIAFTGLIIDGGRDYAARRQSQNASDASSLAGALMLKTVVGSGASADAQIQDTVNQYAHANGIVNPSSEVQAFYMIGTAQGHAVGPSGGSQIPGGATGIRVLSKISFQPFLLNLATGGGPVSSQTVATAQTGVPSGFDNLMPMTIQVDAVHECATFDTDCQLFGGKTGPGQFQWLSYDNRSDEPDLVDYLNQAKPSGYWEIGDWVPGGPGVENGHQVRESLDDWLSHIDPKQRWWTIPIYDVTNGTGTNLTYHIVNFAIFEFDGYNFQGSDKYVHGKFVRTGRLGHVSVPGNCNLNPDGTCAVSLTE